MSDPSIPDWINAIAAAGGALAVIVGLFGAKQTLEANRKSAQELRRSTVAEELITVVLNVEDAFKDIRNRLGSIPKDKIHDKKYGYQQRYERIAYYNALFKDLRQAQIRVRAVIGDTEVDLAVESLFKARSRVLVAIEILANMADEDAGTMDREERDLKVELRRDMYGNFSEKDELGHEITQAVKQIEDKMNSVARLDA